MEMEIASSFNKNYLLKDERITFNAATQWGLGGELSEDLLSLGLKFCKVPPRLEGRL